MPPERSGLALGLVGLVRVVPIVLFSLLAGVAADVFDRRKLMLITQIGGAVVAAVLAALAFAGLSVVWPVYVLAAIGAAVGVVRSAGASCARADARAARAPAERDQPQHGDGAGRVGGRARDRRSASSRSGNVGWAYAFNALSFLFVVAALMMMRDVPETDRATSHARDEISVARGARRPALRLPRRR